MVARTTARLTILLTLVGCLGAYAPGRAVAAEGALNAARRALSRYEPSVDEGSTLRMLTELSAFAQTADPAQRREARFLRAAAATDLLVLARVRDDARLQPALEAALDVPAGSAYRYLDLELADCAQARVYAGPAAHMRAALALASEPEPAKHLDRYRDISGSERDLLFLHAVSKLASDAHAVEALAAYGEPLAEGTPAAQAFDAVGGKSVATLLEAGQALKRLELAAKHGDPLAVSAIVERSVFSVTLPGIVIPASPKPLEGVRWAQGQGTPELLLFAGGQGVRYAFAPSAQLDREGTLKLVGRGEPSLPNTAELRYPARAPGYVHPIAALSEWLSQVLAQQPDCKVAVVVESDAPALALGNVVASLKKAGGNEVTLIGPDPQGQVVAQTVGVEERGQTDPLIAGRELNLRVRLGGYSIKLPNGTDQDIPRVRDSSGWHFDTAALSAQLGRRRFDSSRISFVPGVPGDQVMAALYQVAPNSRSLSLLLH